MQLSGPVVHGAGTHRSVERLTSGHGGRILRTLRAVALFGLFAYAAYTLFSAGGGILHDLFETWVFNGLLFLSAALCLLRATLSPVERRAWLAFGVGLGCWALGELVFTLDPSEVTAGPFPSTSDLLWLVFYPATFLALSLLVRARVRHFYPSLWLDGVVGALVVAALASQFVLPVIISTTGGSLSSVVGDLIYPLGDLLLVSFLVGTLAITGWRPDLVLGTVALGIVLGAVADTMSFYWSAIGHPEPGFFDALWPASAVVLGWASTLTSERSARMTLQGRRLLLFPIGFALAALGMLALGPVNSLGRVPYILSLLAIAGAIIRVGLTFSENLALVDRSSQEALTDPLTSLGNRRLLLIDLDDALRTASDRVPWVLLLLDLNGFKRYNDTFGHPLGDELLVRLAARLARVGGPEGRAYRLGGDEFCVLAPLDRRSSQAVSSEAIAALSEQREGLEVTSACGRITLPADAQDSAAALQLADERLYADKRSASGFPDQLRDVLMQVMAEREPNLHEHLHEVAVMARAVGQRMHLSDKDLETVVCAAELHDVGKVAVPEAILDKPAALDPGERAIIERHCEVGERILAVSPAMGPVARLVRASHESYDGRGYPDGRTGKEIPVGARIIAVCDAFHAMTSDRPYSEAIDAVDAMRELRRQAGNQFDPDVVEALCSVLDAVHPSDRGDGAGIETSVKRAVV